MVQRPLKAQPRRVRVAGLLLVVEGVLTVGVAGWSAARLVPNLAAPELVVVSAIAGALLLAAIVVGGTLMARGARMIRHARRPVVVTGLGLQPLFVATLFFLSLLHSALWLFGIAAGLALVAGVALAPSLRLGHQRTT